jgi:hypothetical protein
MTPSHYQLRAARGWLGLSRKGAARLAGLHIVTIGRAELGHPTVGQDKIEALAAVYTARGFVWLGTTGIERKSP